MGIEFFEESDNSYGFVSDLVKDLNLQWIARNMVNEKYGDIPFIMQILQHPLGTEEKIEERQKVVMAACENPELIEKLRGLIVELSENLDHSLDAIQDSRGKHLMEQTVIGIHVEGIRELVRGLSEIAELQNSYKEVFRDTAFSHFSQCFFEEEPEDKLEEQKALIMHLDGFKGKGEILLQAHIGSGFSLRDVKVVSVSDKARRISGSFFSNKRGQVIADEEVYQDGVDFTNQVLLTLLNQCVPFLQRWQVHLHTMRRQVIFLAGCAGLYRKGQESGRYFCMPDRNATEAKGLYELSLSLQILEIPIPNTISIKRGQGIVVTGANQGGKSTFLRSLGIAQVLCQAGMFVPAGKYPLHAYQNIYTHFTRREDATMNMGKFEEELKRMEEILCHASENTLLLLNESFATTTEVTAYQIAMDLFHTCLEHDVTIWMVTHITKFAKKLFEERRDDVLFLSAGRMAEKETRFQMYEKKPGDTSYGLELYEQMIGETSRGK